MVNRLHSNLCSLADCIRQLQRLFTHNTNSKSITGFLPWSNGITFENPTVFFIFGLRMFVQVCIVTATVMYCVFVIWDKHNLNFRGCASPPHTIPTSTCVICVWDWFVDLLAKKEITMSLNTCLTSTFGMGNVFLSEIWRSTVVY